MNGGRNMSVRRAVVAVAVALSVAGYAGGLAANETITIGTGSSKGVYSTLGRAICAVIKARRAGYDCKVATTKGSIDNIIGLKKGTFDIGIVQSDVQYHAVNGTGVFANVGALSEMRSMFSAHTEALSLLARGDANIADWEHLAGSRLNIGKLKSGTNSTLRLMIEAQGWATKDFRAVTTMDLAQQQSAFCDGGIDVASFLAGHPNSAVTHLITKCGASLITVKGAVVDRLIASNPYYVEAMIPRAIYFRMPTDTPTIGLLATVMTTAKSDSRMIYQVTRSVFENLGYIRSRTPSFGSLYALEMARKGMTAPRHPGALEYLREVGRVR